MAIKHKRKSTTNYVWQSTDLVDGQIGVNTVDGTLHLKKTDNSIETIGGSTDLAFTDLSDVNTSGVAIGDIMQKGLVDWLPVTPPWIQNITSEDIGDLSDVTITTPANDQVLTYSGGSWINMAAPGGSSSPVVQSETFSDPLTIDVSGLVDVSTLTLTGNTTIDFTGGTAGQRFILEVKQDATGSRTITWGSNVRFGTDLTSITLTTTGDKKDRIGLIYDSVDSKYDVVAFVGGF